MPFFRFPLLVLAVVTGPLLFGQPSVRLASPDSRIVFLFHVKEGIPSYEVRFKGMSLISPGTMGLQFRNDGSARHYSLGKTLYTEGEDNYELIIGKTSRVRDHYREAEIPLQDKSRDPVHMILRVRIFNDGLAFRYELPAMPGHDSLELTEENTSFRISGNPIVHALFLPNYTTSHEGEYTSSRWQDLKEDSLMDMPALFEYPDSAYLAITEAALTDYAGMYLLKKGNALVSALSPLPGQSPIKVRARLPHHSPWRVIMISDRVGALIESNILTNLNEPSAIKDVSWLRPGKTTWPWWNGNVVPDTLNAPGNNFVTQKYYIDFCARNGIEYHSVVEYGLHQWYVDDGIPFAPGPHADVTKPVPGLDMKAVCDYARSLGVGIRVWVHFYALYPKLDTAFALYEKWGISGLMVDFMDRDDQEMVNMQTEILKKAAAHHLHIQFHGAYKPTGLHRTYPNEFTREGTLNYEANKWSKRVNPDHDIQFPFTRMLAGSTDYHLGGFRSVTDSAFIVQYTRPLVTGTRCHMLAMYVVLENYLGMVCDYPAAYEGQPGFDFICAVPTVWDETRVLDAKVNQYVLIARRKGRDWYLGAITNHEARTLRVPLSFLGEGSYEATIYTDAPDAGAQPDHLTRVVRAARNSDEWELALSGGGGLAIRLHKL